MPMRLWSSLSTILDVDEDGTDRSNAKQEGAHYVHMHDVFDSHIQVNHFCKISCMAENYAGAQTLLYIS